MGDGADISQDDRPSTDPELRRYVVEFVMSTVIAFHWAAHQIERFDPELGRWLRHKADWLSDAAKKLRREA